MRPHVVAERAQPAGRPGKTIQEGFSLYPEDRRLLFEIMDRYGCSKSETLRTMLRLHAAILGIKP